MDYQITRHRHQGQPQPHEHRQPQDHRHLHEHGYPQGLRQEESTPHRPAQFSFGPGDGRHHDHEIGGRQPTPQRPEHLGHGLRDDRPHLHAGHDTHGPDHHGHGEGDDYGECCPEGSTFMLLSRTDEISRTTPVASIRTTDYQNAYNLETFFTTQLRSSGGFKEQLINFEMNNGWFDVDASDPSATYQPMTGSVSPYASMSPFAMGANGRTTGVVGSFSGVHNPDANAAGTVRFMDVGSDFKVDFSLSNIGNVGGPDEPGLAREQSGSNIDRGINTSQGFDSVSGEAYNQFLEVAPSESAEGSLDVRFSGTDFSGKAWDNPVYGFGFYLMGREDKRDVYLDIYDVNDNLITSELTHGAGVSSSDAAVEYVAFHVCEQEEDIGRFVLREEYDSSSDRAVNRDIFSIDDLTLFSRAGGSGRPLEIVTGPERLKDQITRHNSSAEHDHFNETPGSDPLSLETHKRFGKRHADRILNFRGEQGNVIELSSELFNGQKDIEIARVDNRRELKQISRTDVDLVIWDQKNKSMSMLMVNDNGQDPGFGHGKGVVAILDNPNGFTADLVNII